MNFKNIIRLTAVISLGTCLASSASAERVGKNESKEVTANLDAFDRLDFARITSHPIAFGSGDWTVATGVMEATFSEPMKMPNEKSIPANGKKVKMPIATIAKWKKGCIAEEHLFFDNAEYMKQMGLAK